MVLSTRLLALLLLFIVIPIGFLLVYRSGLPFYHTLRSDAIPSGSYVIPWMRPQPSIPTINAIPVQNQPWDVNLTMQGALKIETTFQLIVPNGTRTIRSTVYLGHDMDFLFVAGIFRGMYSNPTSFWSNYPSTFRVFSNYFQIKFDVDNDGVLNGAESGSGFPVQVPCPFEPSKCGLGAGGWGSQDLVWGYTDLAWTYINPPGRDAYNFATSVCNQPFALGAGASEYNNLNGTLTILFSRLLQVPNSCANDLQIQPGERWVMRFLLELGFSNDDQFYQDFVDGWPRNAYPYTTSDCSWWPQLVIDLSNPPGAFAS